MTFDQLSESANRQVARPWFFVTVLVVLAAWVPSLLLFDANRADLLIDALTNPLSVVLLALLHNSRFRTEEAQDVRQDTVELALAAVIRHLARREDTLSADRDELLRHAELLVESAREATRLSHAETTDDGEVTQREASRP